MNSPSRPALRYTGSKWRIAEEVIARLPPHLHYIEPFGGGAAVLLRKPRSVGEVYNDLDGEVVNFFRVLQDRASAGRLIDRLQLTPFARDEFNRAYEPVDDPVERAARFAIRLNMGHGATGAAKSSRTGFRAHSTKRDKSYAEDWARYPASLRAVVTRLRGVVIENRPAADLIRRFDAKGVLIYADPPYVWETRSERRVAGRPEHSYVHELSTAEHAELLAQLNGCAAMVAISGYRSDLYDQALEGWERTEIAARGPGNAPRTECLWLNPAALAARRDLFDL